MKTLRHNFTPRPPRGCLPGRLLHAFTLVEVMIATALFSVVVAGTIYTQFFGIRMYELTKSKLGASDEARRAIDLMIQDIRTGKIVRIGNGDKLSFTAIPSDTPQQGSAVQIHPTTDTNVFIRYYWDEGDNQLKRTLNGEQVEAVVANFITNSIVFKAEDAFGMVLSNNANNRVISMMLEFYQLQYPIIRIGPGYYYEYYRLSSKITRRTLE